MPSYFTIKMWVIFLFCIVFTTDTALSLSCYTCNSTISGNDCLDLVNKNTFKPQDCSYTAVQSAWWDKFNLFSRIVDSSSNVNPTGGLVENFNDTDTPSEVKDMERLSWLKPKNYQCVTVEKTYSGSKVVERYCRMKSPLRNLCSQLTSKAGSSGYSLSKCLLCEYDGCNSSVSDSLSYALAISVFLVSLLTCGNLF